MSERGSVDWTVGRLFSLVLAGLLIFLVGYGLVNQSFGPLVDNMKYQWDEMSYLLKSMFGEKLSSECYDREVGELVDGNILLKQVGISHMTLGNCQDGICYINWSGYKFRRIDGGIDKFEGNIWVNYEFVRGLDLVSMKEDWERYDKAVDFLEGVGAGSYYDKYFSRKFILFGDGSGGNDNITAIWQSGDWYVQENGEEGKSYDSDSSAIDAFVKEVRGGDDDKVYWSYGDNSKLTDIDLGSRKKYAYLPAGQESCEIYCGAGMFSNRQPRNSGSCSYGTLMNLGRCCCTWKDYGFDVVEDSGSLVGSSIGDLVGNYKSLGIFGDYDELDDDSEVLVLEGEFSRIRLNLLGEIGFSSNDIGSLKSLVEGKSISVQGKNYLVSVEERVEDFPLIVFDSGDDRFGLEFAAFPKRRGDIFPWVELRYFPVYLVEMKNGKWERVGNEEFYRLPEKNFLDVYYGRLVDKFLEDKCR